MYSELSPEILIPKIVNTAEKIKKYALFEKPSQNYKKREDKWKKRKNWDANYIVEW